MAQTVKPLTAMRETWVRSLGQEDPLEKEMATHSRTLAWKIPWMKELVNDSLWDSKESDMTEQLHWFTGSHLHSKLCPSYISGPCWRPTARCIVIDHFSGQQNSHIIRLKFLLWTASGCSFCVFFHPLQTFYRVGTLHLDEKWDDYLCITFGFVGPKELCENDWCYNW